VPRNRRNRKTSKPAAIAPDSVSATAALPQVDQPLAVDEQPPADQPLQVDEQLPAPPATESTALPGWFSAVAALALGVLTALAYFNAAHDALVVDDASFPPQPESVNFASLLRVFREDTWAAARVTSGVYRPLALVFLQLESLLWGKYLPAYHITLIAIHVCTTVMVFMLARELLKQLRPADLSADASLWPAWLAALLFGVHPIHTEAVNSTFNGAEVLATLGVVASLWLIVTRDRRSAPLTWLAVCLAYLAAVLCKESAVTLPLLALLVLVAEAPAGDADWWRRLLPVSWLAIPLLVAATLRYFAIGLGGVTATQNVSAGHAAGLTWSQRIPLLATSLREFSRMIAWPHPLRASYDDFVPSGLASVVVILALVATAAVFMWRRSRVVSVGIIFFYVALLPSSRLVSSLGVVVTLAERYTYLPSVGAAVAAAGGLALLARRWRALPWLVSIPLCLLLGSLTVTRNAQWSSDAALWEADVAAAPRNSDAWKWLVAAYMNTGRMSDAAGVCNRELPKHPDASGFQSNCGSFFMSLGRRNQAEAAFRRSIATSGGSIAHLQLARLLVAKDNKDEAESEYEAAKTMEADPVRRQTILGEQLRRLHPDRLDEAQAAYDTALAIDPRYQPAQVGLKALNQLRAAQP
jgi:hypothetical protein